VAKFDLAIPRILAHEGGYVNHPNDPGGETNFGITDRLDGKIDGKVDVNGDKIPDVDIKSLGIEQAKNIYKRVFWNAMKGDDIESQAIADIMFDGYVNMGNTAIRMMQRILKVEVDGYIGPVTINAINKANEQFLYNAYKKARITYYEELAHKNIKYLVFLRGWKNRVNSFVDI
jgi:lysozyme family protein